MAATFLCWLTGNEMVSGSTGADRCPGCAANSWGYAGVKGLLGDGLCTGSALEQLILGILINVIF